MQMIRIKKKRNTSIFKKNAFKKEETYRIKRFLTVVAVLILLFLAFWFVNHYKKGKIEGRKYDCIDYFEDCHCFGLVFEFQKIVENRTYPPRYSCWGYEYCKEIDEKICKDDKNNNI